MVDNGDIGPDVLWAFAGFLSVEACAQCFYKDSFGDIDIYLSSDCGKN